jgi:hypothetical protein
MVLDGHGRLHVGPVAPASGWAPFSCSAAIRSR